MDKNYHVFSDGRIERRDDTLRVVTDDGDKKHIPVEHAEAVFLHGQIDFNTRFVSFLNSEGVAAHVFGWKDYYSGSVIPEKGQRSGRTVVAQVNAYEDEQQRLRIAREFVAGSIHNMRANVAYYDSRGRELERSLDELDAAAERVDETNDVAELMGVEATARKAYYATFSTILPDEYPFRSREFDPPTDEVNSVISFGNSLVYANCVSAIRATALEPSVSYLHEPGERRYSLSLDIADLFKPVLADRVMFRLFNRGQLSGDDFRSEVGACLLSESGRKTYTKEFEKTLEETVEHPRLDRNVSYQYLLRLEAYKLKKHLLAGEQYDGFRRWW
ncbi:type I-B CRISPR-associated endonuclease Cas1b [Haloparvum sedimenti]|uniref:type I-B CRISPR-associated endonuclease Cas1b n=1 Tax=Haloparvum sedimenti TaxID=1678448 RepID=UPI00071E806E|nr:type I-B CRISPR-associated endonuclease Cas1b [Haloparvum sedimenti]